jgi:prepilin-type N-terminal cleavage/methylation domain-containing protein
MDTPRPLRPSRPGRHGFTLVELLVVITVIAILASMVVPAIGFVQELARRSVCANNQKGIYAALMAYREGSEGGMPDARAKLGQGEGRPKNGAIPNGEACAQYTMGVFEILAASMRDHLPVSVFRCPSQAGLGYRPAEDRMPSLTRQDVTWGWGDNRIPYALDWSAPQDAGSTRVLIGDRDPMNHKDKKTVVCYADGHTKTLDRVRGTGGNDWQSAQGDATTGLVETLTDAVVINAEAKGAVDGGEEDATPDNIYDNNGDYPAKRSADRTRIPGSGDSRRCWLK